MPRPGSTRAYEPTACVCRGCTSRRPRPWHRSCGAEANLQLQSSQTLIRNNVSPTRLLNKVCWKVWWAWRGPSLSSRLVKRLLVADFSKPVPDRLLVITLLRLPRRVVRLWPQSEFVRSNRISQHDVLLFVEAEFEFEISKYESSLLSSHGHLVVNLDRLLLDCFQLFRV